MRNPRSIYLPGFRQPYSQVPGTAEDKNQASIAAQRIPVVRPIVGMRIAADSQVDVLDLYPDGLAGNPRDPRVRIRLSAESPWVGRIDPSDLDTLLAENSMLETLKQLETILSKVYKKEIHPAT